MAPSNLTEMDYALINDSINNLPNLNYNPAPAPEAHPPLHGWGHLQARVGEAQGSGHQVFTSSVIGVDHQNKMTGCSPNADTDTDTNTDPRDYPHSE